MRTMLERDPALLVHDARRRMIAAGAIASATLAPLVTSLVLSPIISNREGDITFLWIVAWGSVVGAVLGGTAVAKALPTGDVVRASVVPRTIGFAALAGAAYFPVLAGGFGAAWMSTALVAGHADLQNFPEMLFAIAVVLALGTIVGAPIGMVFGALFACGTAPTASDLARPAHDLPQRASMWAAVMLAVAAAATLLPALALEGTYCLALFFTVLPGLGVVPSEGTDAAWTRYVVFAAVPSLAALGLALDALVRWYRTARWLRAIERGEHRELNIDDDLPSESALPLRHSDLFADQQSAIVARHELAPYRSVAKPLARIATPKTRRIVRMGSLSTDTETGFENDPPPSAN